MLIFLLERGEGQRYEQKCCCYLMFLHSIFFINFFLLTSYIQFFVIKCSLLWSPNSTFFFLFFLIYLSSHFISAINSLHNFFFSFSSSLPFPSSSYFFFSSPFFVRFFFLQLPHFHLASNLRFFYFFFIFEGWLCCSKSWNTKFTWVSTNVRFSNITFPWFAYQVSPIVFRGWRDRKIEIEIFKEFQAVIDRNEKIK